ncbi:hypothetical protein HMPREF9999_02307 [Alloprevotella sp. oral taxon 473 str. F0040]|nr:hypothetical protein HMPREF9999_02307 [Alloprevotella sp. oral taxon 473 str. F0040]
MFSIVCGVLLFVVLCLLVYKYIRFHERKHNFGEKSLTSMQREPSRIVG